MPFVPFKKKSLTSTTTMPTGNKPGRDNRAKHKPDMKANSQAINLKEAVMGRSKLPSKAPNAKRDVYLS